MRLIIYLLGTIYLKQAFDYELEEWKQSIFLMYAVTIDLIEINASSKSK
jgi:hypothetical protein